MILLPDQWHGFYEGVREDKHNTSEKKVPIFVYAADCDSACALKVLQVRPSCLCPCMPASGRATGKPLVCVFSWCQVKRQCARRRMGAVGAGYELHQGRPAPPRCTMSCALMVSMSCRIPAPRSKRVDTSLQAILGRSDIKYSIHTVVTFSDLRRALLGEIGSDAGEVRRALNSALLCPSRIKQYNSVTLSGVRVHGARNLDRMRCDACPLSLGKSDACSMSGMNAERQDANTLHTIWTFCCRRAAHAVEAHRSWLRFECHGPCIPRN